MNRLWMMVVCVLFLVPLAHAANTCSLEGRTYVCDSGDTITGVFDAVDKDVRITGLSYTYTGARGVEGSQAGESIELTIRTTGKVLIEDSDITVTGGKGLAVTAEDGGAGGSATFQIQNSSKVKITNSDITVTGGIGAAGKADSEDGRTSGGLGGVATFALTNVIDYFNNESDIDVMTGNAGDSDSDDNAASGQAGQNVYFTIDATYYNSTGDITIRPGDGGDAHVDREDSRNGGDAGDAIFSAATTTYENSGLITFTPSVYGNGDVSGSDGGVKYDGRYSELYFQISSANITENGNITVTAIANVATCTDNDEGTESCNARDQPNVISYLNATNTLSFNGVYDITSARGMTATSIYIGYGGDAQDYTINLYGEAINANSGTFDLTGGAGGNGEDDGTPSEHDGDGGSVILNFYGPTGLESSTVTMLSGNSGTCTTCVSGEAGLVTIYGNDTFEVNSTTITLTAGVNDAQTAAHGGSVTMSTAGFSSYSSNITLLTGNSGVTSLKTQFNVTSGDVFVYDSTIKVRSAGTGTCTPGEFYFSDIDWFETEQSQLQVQSPSTCNAYLIGQGEEFNFLNGTTINLTSATGGGELNVTLNGTELQEPGIFRWNYTEIGSTTTANVISSGTYYNGSRSSLTETGTWSYSGTAVNLDADNYFTRSKNVSIYKTSSDAGPNLYDDTSFGCYANIQLDKSDRYDNGPFTPVFKIYKNGALYDTDTGLSSISFPSSRTVTRVNSTVQMVDANTAINDVFICELSWSATITNEYNSTSETINYIYPYNVNIYAGEFKQPIYTLANEYLVLAVNITLGTGEFNSYIQEQCSGTEEGDCIIPVRVTSDTNSTVNITAINLTYGVLSPVGTGDIDIPIVFNSSQEGNVTVSDIYFFYKESEQSDILVQAFVGNNTLNRTISVLQSAFDFNFSKTYIDFFDVFPLWDSQQNVEPWGQSRDDGIFTVNRSSIANHTYEVRAKVSNSTGLACADIYLALNNTNSQAIQINESDYVYLFNMDATFDGLELNGLQGYFKFDEGTTTNFELLSGEVLSQGKGVNGSVNGYSNKGIYFNDSVSTSLAGLSFLDQEYANGTVMLWVKPQTSAINDVIFSARQFPGLDTELAIEISSGSRLVNAKFNNGAADQTIYSFETAPLDTWTHIAVAWNTTNMTIFVNGVENMVNLNLDEPTTVNFSNAIATNDILLGKSVGFSDYLNGTIDELGFWKVKLNNESINDHYVSTYSRVTDSQKLWSWVDFNSCSANDARQFYPEIILKSKAQGTVNTTGFWTE